MYGDYFCYLQTAVLYNVSPTREKYIQSRHINNINFFFFLLFCNFIYLHLRLSIPQRSIPFALLLCVLCLCTHCILTEEIIILATSERDESTSVNELLSRCQQVLWSRPGNLLCVLVWFILDICKVYTCFSYEPNTMNNSNLVKNKIQVSIVFSRWWWKLYVFDWLNIISSIMSSQI